MSTGLFFSPRSYRKHVIAFHMDVGTWAHIHWFISLVRCGVHGWLLNPPSPTPRWGQRGRRCAARGWRAGPLEPARVLPCDWRRVGHRGASPACCLRPLGRVRARPLGRARWRALRRRRIRGKSLVTSYYSLEAAHEKTLMLFFDG